MQHTSGDHPVVTQRLLRTTATIYPLCATFPSANIAVLRNNRTHRPKMFNPFRQNEDDRIYNANNLQVVMETSSVIHASATWIMLRMYTNGDPSVSSLEAVARELNGGYTCKTEDALWQNPQNITIHLNLTTRVVGK